MDSFTGLVLKRDYLKFIEGYEDATCTYLRVIGYTLRI